MNTDLRKWCIEQVIQSGVTGDQVLKKAEEMYAFISEKDTEIKTINLSDSFPLNDTQRQVVETMIEMRRNQEAINGSAISRKMDISQPYASFILRKLKKEGYVNNKGNTYWALKDADGKPLKLKEGSDA